MSSSQLAPARRGQLFATLRDVLAGGERDYTTETIGRAVLLLAVPMVLEMLMESVFAVVDVFWVARLGTDAVAAVGLTEAMVSIIYAVAVGLGMATTAMVSRRIGEKDPEGAGRPDRTEAAVWRTGIYNAAFLSAVAVIFIVWPRQLIGLIVDEPEVLAYGVTCLRLIAYGYGFYAFGMVMVQAFNGAGDTTTPTPTRINLVCYWCFQIPLAWLPAHPAES